MGAFDVVVLGAGTAGVHVATEAADGGKSVAIVEAGLIGGESPYLACLPSNSLLLSAARGQTWEDAVARRNKVTGGLDDYAPARRLADAGVTVIRGTGRIARPGTVEVTLAPGHAQGDQGQDPAGQDPGGQDGRGQGGQGRRGHGGKGDRGQGGKGDRGQGGKGDRGEGSVTLTYADLVIATGCEPVAPPIEGLADIPAWTTAESLSSPDLPRRLIVLGGGAAGCELTQIYAAFGSQVTLVEAEPALLPSEPAFAGEILAAALRRAGAEICLGAAATKAERTNDGLTLALADGTRIDADRLLLASGRRPRLSGLGLDALGINLTPGVALPTSTTCRVTGTSDLPDGSGRVWAAGDVTGTTHTHASHYQARVVAANIIGQRREADYSAIPRCVFTTPSVFAVGIVPQADDGLTTVRADLGDTVRAYLNADDVGAVELYAEDGVLVGAVAVGPDASTWMGEVTLAIRAKVPAPVLADVVHAFPTYGEALETALRELAGTRNIPVAANQEEKGSGQVSELDMETPEDDAIEQHQEVVADENETGTRREVPFEVNEADAAEQEVAVGYDDDDYR
jgi:pyruvate/2-oxoglutarate dehydrogenase complex dihydrolipoamide dehydrogenase (E3) component